MSRPLMRVVTSQAAVGQGGLMSCDIVFDPAGFERRMSIVYDCGSYNHDRLHASIDALTSDVVDVLFLSHLDNDHINGVDVLLDKRRIDTVVIPCLDELEMALVVCRSLATSAAPPGFRDFVKNPIDWFGRRGVKRVVQVGRDDGGDAGPPVPPGEADNRPTIIIEPDNDKEGRPALAYRLRTATPVMRSSAKVGATNVDVLTTSPATQIDLLLHAAGPSPQISSVEGRQPRG